MVKSSANCLAPLLRPFTRPTLKLKSSMAARRIPRASSRRRRSTSVSVLDAGSDGNGYDDFCLIHGLTNHDYDVTPPPVFSALQNTNALFSDTKFDPTIEIISPDLPALRRHTGFPFFGYGFRSSNGK